MASTREYMDYLDERIEIAPANSEEEYQASEVLAGIFKDHGLETRVEEFETHPSGPIFMPILMCIMFVCLIASGVTTEAIHYVLLLVAALCAGLAAFGHFTDSNILEDIGPSSQSQNVVAVHRATGDKVVKGARPIVIVAHYDTPRESLLRKGPLARYQVTLRRITTPMVLAVAAFIVIQALPFLPGMIRTFMWVLSLLCCLPVLFASVADIYDHFAPCTPGSNDNKSSVAALLAIANKVRPAADRVDKAVETGGETMLRRAGDQAVFTPVPRLVQVVEETRGVRHGADVLLSLGILPPTCDVVYEEPRVTVVEEGSLPQDASAAVEEYEEYIEEPAMGEDELEYEAAEGDASYDEAAFEASEETDEYDDGLDEEPQDFDGEEEEYEEDYEDESYDDDDEYIEDEDDDYEEDYDDDDDTPSSLGVWFSERVANIREFFSKNRGSDIDIDRGEDRTLEAEETEEEEEPADDAQDGVETYEESVEEEDEVLSFDDEDDDYDFDDLYPEELYLEEDELEEPLEEPLDEAEEDLAEEDLDDEGLEDEEPEPVEDESEDEEAYIDEFDDSLDWDDEDDLEPVATAEIDVPEDVDVEADEEEARSDYDADYEEEWLEDDGEQYTGEYAVEDQEDAAPTLWERIKLFFQRLWAPDDTEEQIGDYEEEYVEFEDYDEEVYEENDEDEAEEETPAYEPLHYEVEEPPVSDEETDQFAEDDLYDDDYQEEEAYVIEEEYEDYEDEAPEEVEEPLIDPNVLHFDYEEDADILPRDTTGLDTISDSYDLYDDEVGRVAHRDRPQPVEDPSWGVTSYQPPRPAMNIARRAALLDLPDPSEAFVDPLASYAYGYAPYVEDEYDEYVSYDEQPYEDEVPDVEEIQPIEEDPVVEDFAEDFLEEEPVEEPEEELEEQAYPEDDLLEDEFLDLDEYADEEPIPQPKPERKSFWGKEESSDWKGGATQRMDLREEEPLVIDADDLQDAILELGDEYLVAHDIWFVATGASQTSHAGIQAFIDAHRKDIRGAFLVNLDSIGVGSLALVVNEGLHTSRRADRRLVRLLSGIAQDLHVQIETAMMNWTDLESTITSRSRVRSVTIMGIDDNVLPANSHTMDDVPEHVNPRQVSNVVRMVTELIRRS
ncbi:MAG: M28 family peptidase [Coriobacteriales bacterium]|nr:M28 family peptidase [Coriobacteriales bacterium]